jgi:hypothetical protein
MRKTVSIGFAIAALTVTALPAFADDQSISFATGMIGGSPEHAYDRQAPARSRQYGAYWRVAPSQQMSPEAYAGYAQGGGYAPSGEYTQRNCTYVGGPKGDWTCW